MKKTRCPKCNHPDIHVVYEGDVEFIRCPSCKYDETLMDIAPEERSHKKSRAPYKTGGSERTQKKA